MTNIVIRPAGPDDADHLARFINMASEGLSMFLWQQIAAKGQDPWEVGRQRACDPDIAFNWRNAEIAVADGVVAGAVIYYPLADKQQPIAEDLPAIFVPLVELENLAPGTLYINVLATYPEFRGQGIASRLMQQVESKAGHRDISLIVDNHNQTAISLYRKLGFEMIAARPIIDGGWNPAGDEYCLMIRRRGK